MSNKYKVLDLLEKNIEFESGESLSKKLSISRTSIWKSVNSLIKDGYNIKTSKKGYLLEKNNDILSKDKIIKLIENKCFSFEIYNEVSSTNDLLKQKGNSLEEFHVIISNSQTKGRGRFDRSFHSPKDSGIYMSILLKPKSLENITVIAAVAMSEAIEKLTNSEVKIKWVNDLYINNKKVCGILTEASISVESKEIEYVVLGLGINIYKPVEGFPKDILQKASYINNELVCNFKNNLISTFLDIFYNYYKNNTNIIDKYRNRNFVLGKYIILNNSNERFLALEIDENCNLIVKDDFGIKKVLKSGEVSIIMGEEYES